MEVDVEMEDERANKRRRIKSSLLDEQEEKISQSSSSSSPSTASKHENSNINKVTEEEPSKKDTFRGSDGTLKEEEVKGEEVEEKKPSGNQILDALILRMVIKENHNKVDFNLGIMISTTHHSS